MTDRSGRAWLRSLPAALVTVLFAVAFGMVAATAVSALVDNPPTVEETPVVFAPGVLRLMIGAAAAAAAALLASVIFRSLRFVTWGLLGRAVGLPRPAKSPPPDERIYFD